VYDFVQDLVVEAVNNILYFNACLPQPPLFMLKYPESTTEFLRICGMVVKEIRKHYDAWVMQGIVRAEEKSERIYEAICYFFYKAQEKS